MHSSKTGFHFARVILCFWALLMLSCTVQAQAFLDVNKSFSPINPNVGQTAQMVITFANTSLVNPATLVAGTDTLPAGLAYVNAGTGTCGLLTSVAAPFTAGASMLWSGGTIAPNSSCTITAVVTPFAVGTWVNNIPPSNVSGSLGAASLTGFSTASATITAGGAYLPITGVKTISGTPLHGGGTRSYTITLTNPNARPLTGMGFTDTLPNTLQMAVPGGVTANSCGGSFGNTVGGALADGDLGFRLNGGSLGANTSCSVTFHVRAANITTFQAGNSTNTIGAGAVTTTQSITNAAFNVAFRIERGVTIAKSFTPATMTAGGTSSLAITIVNYNLQSIPNVALTDTFPAGMSGVSFTSATGCGTPTVTVTPASADVSNVTLPPAPNANANGGSSCVIRMVVTASVAGSYTNTLPASSFAGGFTYVAAAASLVVTGTVGGAKRFTPNITTQNGTSVLTLTLTNAAPTPAANLSFTDDLFGTMGGGISIDAAPPPTNSCGGTLVAGTGATSFSLSGGSIPAASRCVITLPVIVATGALIGLRTNTIPAGAITTSLGTNTAAVTGTLTIASDVGVSKSFSPNAAPQSGSSVLTIILSNGAGGPNAVITSFTDNLLATMGAGITIGSVPAPTNSCGGTLSAVPGSTTIALMGGLVTAGGNCQLTIPMDIAANAVATVRTNSVPIGGLVTDQGSNAVAATANLTIVPGVTISKVYFPGTIGPSQQSRLTVTMPMVPSP
jgi:uncharacterized repeat protein (TIGR01451 family)